MLAVHVHSLCFIPFLSSRICIYTFRIRVLRLKLPLFLTNIKNPTPLPFFPCYLSRFACRDRIVVLSLFHSPSFSPSLISRLTLVSFFNFSFSFNSQDLWPLLGLRGFVGKAQGFSGNLVCYLENFIPNFKFFFMHKASFFFFLVYI